MRRRCGRGFAYLDTAGGPVTPEDRDRIRALVIPPAWRDVWICPWPNGHIQAVGIDDAGRRQYLYHDEWRRQRDELKYDRVLELAPLLPDFRKAVEADLVTGGRTKARAVAVGLRMLDQGAFRTGNEEYADQHGSYGVATLLREHVSVRGGRVGFDYLAKGGVRRTVTLTDPQLAKAVASLRRAQSGSDRLLVYRKGREWQAVHAEDVNERFRELVGADFSVKDLRTWNATVLASSSRSHRSVTRMYREVADHLGNTPSVARKSYVDPRLVDLFERGETIGPALGDLDMSRTEIREPVERAVYDLLS